MRMSKRMTEIFCHLLQMLLCFYLHGNISAQSTSPIENNLKPSSFEGYFGRFSRSSLLISFIQERNKHCSHLQPGENSTEHVQPAFHKTKTYVILGLHCDGSIYILSVCKFEPTGSHKDKKAT